ncbi:MAG: hypothetical protein MZV64_22595 [Ignavibacteriales bacterium]|nr:hypothetical protein [Ignavibacteriales bacterium]
MINQSSSDYSVPIEKVNDKLDIVRIRCGGGKYIRKELLWNHLEEFIDKSIKYLKAKKDFRISSTVTMLMQDMFALNFQNSLDYLFSTPRIP